MPDRTLSEVLQSTSDCLFPAEMGGAKVNIDSTGYDGDTPLHVLIWRGDTDGALLLIENGAPIDAVGEMGETPLHAAISMQNMSVVEALIRSGARIDIVSEFGKTALDCATDEGITLTRNT
jgi:ankyrin repeat protein